VLFAVEGYRYNGHSVEVRERLREVLPRLSRLERLVIVPYADHGVTLPGAVSYAGFRDREAPLDLAQMPFDHPLYILYSSGTTGAPGRVSARQFIRRKCHRRIMEYRSPNDPATRLVSRNDEDLNRASRSPAARNRASPGSNGYNR